MEEVGHAATILRARVRAPRDRYCTSLTATLVPVQGPLSLARPLRTIDAKATGTGGYNGGLSWQMPDGELCTGRWSIVNQTGSFAFTSANLLSTYRDTHLSGFSPGSTAGWNRGYAVVTCSQSRTLRLSSSAAGTASASPKTATTTSTASCSEGLRSGGDE